MQNINLYHLFGLPAKFGPRLGRGGRRAVIRCSRPSRSLNHFLSLLVGEVVEEPLQFVFRLEIDFDLAAFLLADDPDGGAQGEAKAILGGASVNVLGLGLARS